MANLDIIQANQDIIQANQDIIQANLDIIQTNLDIMQTSPHIVYWLMILLHYKVELQNESCALQISVFGG